VTATPAAEPAGETSTSATAIRWFAKAATARRRPLGENRTSSVRPSPSSPARTSGGASKAIEGLGEERVDRSRGLLRGLDHREVSLRRNPLDTEPWVP